MAHQFLVCRKVETSRSIRARADAADDEREPPEPQYANIFEGNHVRDFLQRRPDQAAICARRMSDRIKRWARNLSRLEEKCLNQYDELGIPYIAGRRLSKYPRGGWKQFQTRPMAGWERLQRFGPDGSNVFVLCANHVVRDFDKWEDYVRWRDKHPELAARCPTARTRRGAHVWLDSDRAAIRERLGTEHFKADHTGELKYGAGSYAAAWPSKFRDRKAKQTYSYEWIVPLGPLPDIPADQLDEVELMLPSWLGRSVDRRFTQYHEKGVGGVESESNSAGVNKSESDHDVKADVLHKAEDGSQHSASNAALLIYVREILTLPRAQAIDYAIANTLPTLHAKREKGVMRCARLLRTHPELNDLDESEVLAIARTFWKYAEPISCETTTPEQHEYEFARAYFKAKVVREPGPKFDRIEFRKQFTFANPPCINDLRTVCIALQQLHISEEGKAEPFPLACRFAGEILGVSHTTAKDWIDDLVSEGLLQITRLEIRTPNGGRAREYICPSAKPPQDKPE